MAVPVDQISPEEKRAMGVVSRRRLLHFAAAAALTAPHSAWPQAGSAPSRPVRAATGLRATWQSTAWLGAESGLFNKYSIDLTVPAIAVGGPEAGAGLGRGDRGVADTRGLDVAEE